MDSSLRFLELVGDVVGDDLIFFNDGFIGDGIADGIAGGSADDHVLQFHFDGFTFVDGGLGDAVDGTAIDLVDDDVLCHVGELAGEVTGVGGLQSRVGQSLSGTVGGAEIFQHGEAFAEVGLDGGFDDFAGRLGHQTTHATELPHLVDGASGFGGCHHVDGVEVLERAGGFAGDGLAFGIAVIVGEAFHQIIGDLLAGVAPEIDQLGVTFLIGDGTLAVGLFDGVGFFLAGFENGGLAVGRADVGDAEAEGGQRAALEAEGLHVIEQIDRGGRPSWA